MYVTMETIVYKYFNTKIIVCYDNDSVNVLCSNGNHAKFHNNNYCLMHINYIIIIIINTSCVVLMCENDDCTEIIKVSI